ncbi:hypothetical protein [Photobacterium sp. TY1-4]|uniref:hypothetical protein n=1 Tax=Photobacterium sp. TY1-4 TaxID=2899122 RepID=UPI0021C2475C|nr:hypothetical protein [Photobacterium sp. TY1-4]UXI04690.1 hypothetical protein NH461_25325 [Photobacterium sp. TY1-4]
MSNQPAIHNLDEIQAEYFISDVIVRTSDGCVVLYVPKDKISERAQKGFVSLKQLDNLQRKLKQEYDVDSELILSDSDSLAKMSEGFETLLKTTFPDIIDGAQVYFLNSQKVSVTIKFSDAVEINKKETIETFLKTILTSAKIEVQSLQWDEIELPSLIELLTVTKKLQPVKLKQVYDCLHEGYPSLQENWLNKQLDKLIKKRFLVREQATETYALTAHGLNVLPKIASRNNSDIVRALDLGRRKW